MSSYRLRMGKQIRLLACLFVLLAAASHAALAQFAQEAADSLHSPSSSQKSWSLAAAAPSIYTAADEAPRLHVGVLSVPLWGHFKPLWAIAEELAHRGHTVSVVVEEPSWCATVLSSSRHPTPLPASNVSAAAYASEFTAEGTLDVYCIVVPRVRDVFDKQSFQAMTRAGSSVTLSFVTLFNDLFRHHELALGSYIQTTQAIHAHHPLTTMLCDIVTYACTSTARHMNLPVVHSFPFTTQLSVGLHPLLPAVGLGFPRHMSLAQRTTNFAFKFLSMIVARRIVRSLNSARAAHGVAPFRDAYDVAGMYAPLITPTLWGLDIPQPLCANVHPVGPLNTRDQRLPYRRLDLSADLADFLDRCTQGVLYVNWGTLAAPTTSMEDTLLKGLVAAVPYCIVWKRRASAATAPAPPSDRFFVTTWLSSPMAVLRHPHTLAFVSHCGDASVLEAVEAAVPIIGFPLFADQADVCQRVVESGIGAQVTQTKSFTPADVQKAVNAIRNRRGAMASRLRELRAIAAAYGGPSRAADIVEARQYNLLLNRPSQLEQCGGLDDALRLDYLLLVWSATVASMALAWTCLIRIASQRLSNLLTPLARRAEAQLLPNQPKHEELQPHRVHAVPRAYKAHKQL